MTFKEQVLTIIKRIPRGQVATYGQIAAIASSPRAALMVGRILRQSSESEQLPWQRVINSQGRISIVNMDYPAELQAELLRQEGVIVTENRGYFVDLSKYLWQPLDFSTKLEVNNLISELDYNITTDTVIT